MRPQPECPECQKLLKVEEKSNIIGEFLDYFLPSKGIVLAKYGHADATIYNEDLQDYEEMDEILFESAEYRGTNGINKLLAEYFGVDLDKVERERRELLKWLQEAQ